MADINGYSIYLATKLQDHFMKTGSAFSQLGTVWLALSVGTHIQTDGTGLTEPSPAFGYVRLEVSDVPTDKWNAATGDDAMIDNMINLSFAQSHTGSWGNIVDVGVYDAGTIGGGNLLWGGPLATPKTIEPDTIAVFIAGSLVIKSASS